MSRLSELIASIKNQKGIKGAIKRKLFAPVLAGLEAADAENAELRRLLGESEARLQSDLETACLNLRNNNALLERLSSDSDAVKLKLYGIERERRSAPAEAAAGTPAAAPEAAAMAAASSGNDYADIDYFDFENHFRGSIESVKRSQEFYLRYFRDKKRVVDIGCGRGEFLSLMRDNGIRAEGVDIYEPYAEYCKMQGLEAACGDGADFLARTEGVDGIFVGQVVEHLKPGEIIRLCNTAYERLAEGGCIVIETPNPTSLSIYTNAFYIDPSHIKPVHPLTMQYYLEKAGFRDIEIVYTQSSRPPFEIPALKTADQEFNEAMKRVSDMMFGSQDYAVIAVKKG